MIYINFTYVTLHSSWCPGPLQAVVGLVSDGAAVVELLPVHLNALKANFIRFVVGQRIVADEHGNELSRNHSAGKSLEGSENDKPNHWLVESHDDFVEELVGTVKEGQVSSLDFGDKSDCGDASQSEGLLHFEFNIYY